MLWGGSGEHISIAALSDPMEPRHDETQKTSQRGLKPQRHFGEIGFLVLRRPHGFADHCLSRVTAYRLFDRVFSSMTRNTARTW
jgi:hypothetical protein